MSISFGYLSPTTAAEALTLEAPFSDDPELQAQYEQFLLAQSGESRDYFSLPCGKSAGFSKLCDEFSRAARESVGQ